MVLMLSIFGGMVDLGCNVLLVDVWTGNEQGSAAMNLLHFMWGVGSFLAPLVAEGVGLEPSRLQATWTTIGVVSAALGVPIWFVPSPPTEDRSHEDDIADEKTIASDLSPPKVARMTRFSFGAAIVALSMYYFCYAGYVFHRCGLHTRAADMLALAQGGTCSWRLAFDVCHHHSSQKRR